jgi:hypothetical protein
MARSRPGSRVFPSRFVTEAIEEYLPQGAIVMDAEIKAALARPPTTALPA